MNRLIAIVGRPNVGKSTLFNRICGHRSAIVRDTPGVTRDRNYQDADWAGHPFILVDTGGFEPDAEDELLAGMRTQAQLAVDEAAGIIFVVDARTGLTAADEEIAQMLRRSGTPTVIAANKVDSQMGEQETGILADVARLGLDAHPISAEHGRGVGDLLDALLEIVDLPREIDPEEEPREAVLRMAVIGRPNVGKSTLLNGLLGEDRFLATEVAGTTRDSLDATLRYQNTQYVLTDTAGIRRKASISEDLERYTVIRALRSVENSDVAVLLLDATEPAVSQDARLAKLVIDRGRGLVLVVNKWDLVQGEEDDNADALRKRIWEELPEVRHAPIILTSALEGKRIFKVLEEVKAVYERQNARIGTSELNRWLEHVTRERPPPMAKGRPNRFFYASQVGRAPPKFVLNCARPEDVPEHYRRYLANQLRETYPFSGVTLRISFRPRGGR